ncbi:hypothetical protein AB3S75_020161 [Citrus x aurantiifolia]
MENEILTTAPSCANYKKGYCGLPTHTAPTANEQNPHQNAAVSHASSLCSVLSPSTFSLYLAVGVSTPGRWIYLSVSTRRLQLQLRVLPLTHSATNLTSLRPQLSPPIDSPSPRSVLIISSLSSPSIVSFSFTLPHSLGCLKILTRRFTRHRLP